MDKPLIAGAGPVGLAAALFLADRGIEVRLIEQAAKRAPTSRALAVNPRTLDLLEPSGVTAEMLARGLKIEEARLHHGDSDLGRISLAEIGGKHPFMLALSQATSEALLAQAFEARGGSVERGTKLVSCGQHAGIDVTLATPAGSEINRPQWLLAADGAHSGVRQSLHIDFKGSTFPEAWTLLDMPMEGEAVPQAAHIRFFDDGGFVFYIRVVEDIRREQPPFLWRIISNMADPVPRLPDLKSAGPAVWSSSFHIAHRLAATLNDRQVYLAGDAAHIHSPIGARGMNLGIEDAWVFAELAARDRLNEYGPLRRHVDGEVVRRIKTLTTLVRGHSPAVRLLRDALLPTVLHLPVHAQILGNLTGLDHDLKL